MYCQGLCEGWKGQRVKIVVSKYSILPTELGVGVDVLGGTTRQRGLSRSRSHRWPLGEQSHVWISQHSVPPHPPMAQGLCLCRETSDKAIQGQ